MGSGDLSKLVLQRFDDWPARLDTALTEARTRPFEWGGGNGGQDCCLFPADVVKALTGVDFAAEYRGQYHSQFGAVRIMRKIAGGGVDAVATRALGEPLPFPLMAQRGDVVAFAASLGLSLGICLGARIAATGPEGLTFVSITDALMAWHV
jgi:hypothetical protein